MKLLIIILTLLSKGQLNGQDHIFIPAIDRDKYDLKVTWWYGIDPILRWGKYIVPHQVYTDVEAFAAKGITVNLNDSAVALVDALTDRTDRIAGVCLTLDDTWYHASWVTADATLKAYGWKASFAITTTPTNDADEDTTEITAAATNLNKLIVAGHELSNHSLRHKSFAYYTLTEGYTRQQYLDNMILSQQGLINSVVGYDPPSYIYCSWTGTDSLMSAMILNEGFETVRYGTEYYPLDFDTICYDSTSQIVTAWLLDPYTEEVFTDEQIIAVLDYARDNNKIVVFCGHKIVTELTANSLQVLLSRMQMICQYVLDNEMFFYRLSDLKPEIFE